MERVDVLRSQASRLRELARLEGNPARHQRFLSLATQSENLADSIEYELTVRHKTARLRSSSTSPGETQRAAVVGSTRASPMHEHRDLRMCKDFYRFAAEHQRGDPAATVRGHDDQVAAFRPGSVDDRLVRVLMLAM